MEARCGRRRDSFLRVICRRPSSSPLDRPLSAASGQLALAAHAGGHGRSGVSHVIVIETPNDVILTDEEGEYRLVGTARGNLVTAADPEDEFLLEQGFFHFKVNLSGDNGLFGTVDFLLRRSKNGEEVVRDRGSCHFA